MSKYFKPVALATFTLMGSFAFSSSSLAVKFDDRTLTAANMIPASRTEVRDIQWRPLTPSGGYYGSATCDKLIETAEIVGGHCELITYYPPSAGESDGVGFCNCTWPQN